MQSMITVLRSALLAIVAPSAQFGQRRKRKPRNGFAAVAVLIAAAMLGPGTGDALAPGAPGTSGPAAADSSSPAAVSCAGQPKIVIRITTRR
jgi:hypothetical protein